MYPGILLIDDDDDDQFIFLTALENVAPDSHCDIANNALEAFQYLHTRVETPDMIFLDLNMPLMNGFEFLLILKNDPRFSLVPVIIFSTSDNPEDLARAKDLGALQFITKTADIELLKKDLRFIFNKTGVMESVIL
jgi:CheY-like chemotaxis protein